MSVAGGGTGEPRTVRDLDDDDAGALARLVATLLAEATTLDRLDHRHVDAPDRSTRSLVERAEAEAFALFCQDLATLLAQLAPSPEEGPDAGTQCARGRRRRGPPRCPARAPTPRLQAGQGQGEKDRR